MELNRFDLASIKRTAQNVKMLRRKLEKVTEKHNQICTEKSALEEEIANWETPILKKYGYSSEQILSGEADRMIAEAGKPEVMAEPQPYEAPAQEEWIPEPAAPAVSDDMPFPGPEFNN